MLNFPDIYNFSDQPATHTHKESTHVHECMNRSCEHQFVMITSSELQINNCSL
jgi:hypothetical protein